MNSRMIRMGLDALKVLFCIGFVFLPIYVYNNYYYGVEVYSIFNLILHKVSVSSANMSLSVITLMLLFITGLMALADAGLIFIGRCNKKLGFKSSALFALTTFTMLMWSFIAPATYGGGSDIVSYGYIAFIFGVIFLIADFVLLRKEQ